jgi:hypothetical protein
MPGDLTLVIRPLEKPASRPLDDRRLGLPIFSLELEAAATGTSSPARVGRAPLGR